MKKENFYKNTELINVRDISDFLYCKRRVWLKKIKKIKKR